MQRDCEKYWTLGEDWTTGKCEILVSFLGLLLFSSLLITIAASSVCECFSSQVHHRVPLSLRSGRACWRRFVGIRGSMIEAVGKCRSKSNSFCWNNSRKIWQKKPQTSKPTKLPRNNSKFFLACPNPFLTDLVCVSISHPTEICPV